MQVVGKYAKSGRETAFTAIGLSKEGANKYMFMLKDRNTGTEKQTSVAQYFTKVLGVQLQFPALQCVLVRSTPASCRAPPALQCVLEHSTPVLRLGAVLRDDGLQDASRVAR